MTVSLELGIELGQCSGGRLAKPARQHLCQACMTACVPGLYDSMHASCGKGLAMIFLPYLERESELVCHGRLASHWGLHRFWRYMCLAPLRLQPNDAICRVCLSLKVQHWST